MVSHLESMIAGLVARRDQIAWLYNVLRVCVVVTARLLRWAVIIEIAMISAIVYFLEVVQVSKPFWVLALTFAILFTVLSQKTWQEIDSISAPKWVTKIAQRA